MRRNNRQSDFTSWLNSLGPIVVVRHGKNIMNKQVKSNTRNRDGPLIYHTRDGPPSITGPPRGTGPPILSGSGPPKKAGPPMDWLAKKKTLMRPY